MRVFWLLLILAVCGVPLAFCQAEDARTFPVGIARVDITPEYPVPLSGYAARGSRLFDRVEQRLWARGIAVLDPQGRPRVLITVDSCGVPAAVTKQVVAKLNAEHGTTAADLVVCSTHTHSAPMLTGVLPNLFTKDLTSDEQAVIARYTQDLATNLTQVAERAIADAQPAYLEWGVSTASFAKNRRQEAGPVDHDVPILVIRSPEGEPRAILVNYACHCTSLSPVPFMSGDWAGCAVEGIEAEFPTSMAMVAIGCGADQNPKVRGDDQGAARVNGRGIVDAVRRRLQTGLTAITGDLMTRGEEITLPLATLPTEDEWKARAQQPGITGYHARKNLKRLEQGESLPDEIEYPVQSWIFGDDLAMVFLGGEVVVDYSLAIKGKYGEKLWVSAYANDVPCYIPSERVLAEGGYEGRNAMVWYDLPGPFAPGLEEKILKAVASQIPANYQPSDDVSQTGGKRPLSPEESISRMNVADDLQVEVVAAEPLVVDPVAVEFGPDGKLWVVEMRDYPEGIDGNLAPGGVVKFLEDLDQDGVYDQATVFLEGLAFPTGLMVWKQGILVCTAPDVLYAEDTDGDGKADVRQTVLTGFATHNYQARVNSLAPGLDDWVYASGGLFGGVIESFNGQTVNVTNRDFRFRPDTGELEPVSGRTQQGRVRDDSGAWFGCRNGSLCLHYPVEESYYRKNPYVVSPPAEVAVPRGPDASQLYPVGELVQFHLSGQRGRPTSACGLGLYRDVALGQAFYGNAFVCEPVNQLVHRRILQPEGVTFAGYRADEEQDREFLSSTDNWFRPVQMRTAPDGSLLIVDMYRYLIEHPKFLSPESVQELNVRAGETRGRIYRVTRKGQQLKPIPNLKQLDTPELASLMESQNGTLRDMVQQELCFRKDQSAAPVLRQIATNAEFPAARLQALWTLNTLQALDAKLLRPRISDHDPAVRRTAIRLAEPFLNESPELANAVLGQTGNEQDVAVLLQLAYSLGELNGERATVALLNLMQEHADNVYIRSAVLTSFEPARLPSAIANLLPQVSENPKLLPVLKALTGMAVAANQPAVLNEIAGQLTAHAVSNPNVRTWEWTELAKLMQSPRSNAEDQSEAFQQQLKVLSERARKLVSDADQSVEQRVAVLEFLLSLEQTQDDFEFASELLAPQSPLKLQIAAVTNLIAIQNPDALSLVFENWSQFTPALQQEVLNQLLLRESTTKELLVRVEQKQVRPPQIDSTNRQRLLDHQNTEIKQRAQKLFSAASSASREQVLKQYQSIDLKQGDRERGRLVFEKQCSSCHRLDGNGHAVGPDLAALTDQSKSFLLTAILDPNKAIDGRYASYVAVTDDGKLNTGILVSEQSNSITLKAQQGKVLTVLRSQIDGLINTGKSLMPEGLERDIPPAAMADLLVYLQEHSAPLSYKYAGIVKPDATYPDEPAKLKLVDRMNGTDRFNDGQWVGFRFAGEQPQPRIELDLGKKTTVQSLRIVYGVNHEPGSIHAPRSIQISFSNNGQEFGNAVQFSDFDDHPDGLGLYEIDRRVIEIKLPEQTARFVRIDFQSTGHWLFLSEISLSNTVASDQHEGVPVSSAETKPSEPEVDPVATIRSLVADVEVGTPDEYRHIPEIWRQAFAVGKRNQGEELERLLAASLPGFGEPLQCWQAVVLGGGIINGLTIAGEWPRERIEQILKSSPPLEVRWRQSLHAASRMADDPTIKSGTRYDALRMIAMLDYEKCQQQLKRYLTDPKQAELQMGAVSGLGDIDVPETTQALIEALPDLTPRNRKLAAEALIRTDQRAFAVLQALKKGSLASEMIEPSVQQQLKESENPEIQEQANAVFP
ncbi:neutral/alkaline non-lysosomal ceramidase N-terminal domain-containing protein [Rubinisphaera margarita]|uniref:neutral/alkaline non-lysosomal ceramidase N-terminal domain-containing protein n=1 Tax=Rubinisphaera margarita TaxID=2909586 RepID=UPI001EE78C15|nr:neutral/alkaline non-lysosomal ceramidase N-terminal domain-containing protein [Rubinisphaera margarita]MCG6158128.1 neutral/alkaline non-lysosomal ceramidase N-terminal domain-containing protein [Rubinisphaera margarita]